MAKNDSPSTPDKDPNMHRTERFEELDKVVDELKRKEQSDAAGDT